MLPPTIGPVEEELAWRLEAEATTESKIEEMEAELETQRQHLLVHRAVLAALRDAAPRPPRRRATKEELLMRVALALDYLEASGPASTATGAEAIGIAPRAARTALEGSQAYRCEHDRSLWTVRAPAPPEEL